MDRLLYVAGSGANRALDAQAQISHNLANASTVGFKAVLASAEAAPVAGPGRPTRVNTQLREDGFDTRAGAMISTGNPLDIALREDNWLMVQAADGSTAMTRAGNLQINPLGQLTTASGLAVLGDGGPLALPPHDSLTIGSDGTVSVVPAGQGPETQLQLGRLNIVNAPPAQLQRRADGLFEAAPGFEPEPAPGAVLASGMLESSNVNLAATLVQMIENQRSYELAVKAMKTAEDNAEQATNLLRLGG